MIICQVFLWFIVTNWPHKHHPLHCQPSTQANHWSPWKKWITQKKKATWVNPSPYKRRDASLGWKVILEDVVKNLWINHMRRNRQRETPCRPVRQNPPSQGLTHRSWMLWGTKERGSPGLCFSLLECQELLTSIQLKKRSRWSCVFFSFNSSSPHPCLFSTLSNSWKTESMTLKRSTVSSGSK